jgi:hypothetical protein
MHFFRNTVIVLIFVAVLIRLDFWAANNAHQQLLRTAVGFKDRLENTRLDFDGPRKQGCEIKRVYLVNAYQTCFDAWYGEPGDGIAGFTFVYHRPMPLVLFYGQTAESRYFSYSEYGTRLKEVRRDGYVNHLLPKQVAE